MSRYKCLLTAAAIAVALTAWSNMARAAYTRTVVTNDWKMSPNYEPVTSSSNDAVSPAISLPFPFPFQDDVFTQLRIHSNGFVTLGGSAPNACGSCIFGQNLGPTGNSAAPDYVIAPWWADWDPTSEGDVYYGLVDDAFVVEWWYLRPNGGGAGQTYAFSLQLFADGRFRFLYGRVAGGFAPRDYGNTASIGYQGRSSARFGESVLYTNGAGGNLYDGLAYEFRRGSDALSVARFNLDGSVPDIVERWAPVIWADIDQGDGRCDHLTNVDFDGDWLGLNNSSHSASNSGYSMPASVYYAWVQTTTHDFLGYYFYHARDCSSGHEHDWEGVTIAVSRATGTVDAVLTNVHGVEIPYHSPFDTSITNIPRSSSYGDSPTFTFFSLRDATGPYDTVAVGIEANTHAVWGRWHNRCVIGSSGSPSGCDSSHGGDGIAYVYGATGDAVPSVPQYPNWLRSGRVRYRLLALTTLYDLALRSNYCGQGQATALYACQTGGLPSDLMNSSGGDAGDLPWVWGVGGVVSGTACTGRNMMIQPGYIFSQYFNWPAGRLNACDYSYSPFRSMTTTCAPLSNCP